ncbi:MAG: hypothetical protein HQM10_23215 [Candidatus Riflebacteria bacterium]|nr:hypothetical protein [Candidatus Riflebacteria bacterium]
MRRLMIRSLYLVVFFASFYAANLFAANGTGDSGVEFVNGYPSATSESIPEFQTPTWKMTVYNLSWPFGSGRDKIQRFADMLRCADQKVTDINTICENNAGRITQAEIVHQPVLKLNEKVLKEAKKVDLAFNLLGDNLERTKSQIMFYKGNDFYMIKVEIRGWTNGGQITNVRLWMINKEKYATLMK